MSKTVQGLTIADATMIKKGRRLYRPRPEVASCRCQQSFRPRDSLKIKKKPKLKALDSTKVVVAEEVSIGIPCLIVMRKRNAEKKEMSIVLP